MNIPPACNAVPSQRFPAKGCRIPITRHTSLQNGHLFLRPFSWEMFLCPVAFPSVAEQLLRYQDERMYLREVQPFLTDYLDLVWPVVRRGPQRSPSSLLWTKTYRPLYPFLRFLTRLKKKRTSSRPSSHRVLLATVRHFKLCLKTWRCVGTIPCCRCRYRFHHLLPSTCSTHHVLRRTPQTRWEITNPSTVEPVPTLRTSSRELSSPSQSIQNKHCLKLCRASI